MWGRRPLNGGNVTGIQPVHLSIHRMSSEYLKLRSTTGTVEENDNSLKMLSLEQLRSRAAENLVREELFRRAKTDMVD